MPKPIMCLADTLHQYAQVYTRWFFPYTSLHFVIVLRALVEAQGHRSLSTLHHRLR